MRVFEAQRQHDEEAGRLREVEASRGREVEGYAAQLASCREEVQRLGMEKERMAESLQSLVRASERAGQGELLVKGKRIMNHIGIYV